MAKLWIQPADMCTFTAPAGGVVAGTCVKIGDILVYATQTVAATFPFVGARVGVIEHAKTSAQAWTEGAQVNWDNTLKVFTTVTTGFFRAGVAYAAAANPSPTGKVLLAGVNLGAALA